MKSPIALRVLLLSGLSSSAAAADKSPRSTSCQLRAEVSAADLAPETVVEGNVQVQLDGECDEVATYEIVLRFSERSVVRTRRKNVTIPTFSKSGVSGYIFQPAVDNSIYNDGIPFGVLGANQTAFDEYKKSIENPSLWVVREEERIGFETKYALSGGKNNGMPVMIKPFAVLVPYTNFPPAFDRAEVLPVAHFADTVDIAHSEHIYQYLVDVTFKNGTTVHVPAGYTTFNPVGAKNLGFSPETINITMALQDFGCGKKGDTCDPEHEENPVPRDTFTLEVAFPKGRHHYQGSRVEFTVISHQIGPGIKRPFALRVSLQPRRKQTWAAKHAADNATAQKLLDPRGSQVRQLLPTASKDGLSFPKNGSQVWERHYVFSNDGIIENGAWFTSKQISTHFLVDQNHYPTFGMYYQSVVTEVKLQLQIHNVTADPVGSARETEGEERALSAYQKGQSSMKRPFDYLQGTFPVFIYPRPEDTATHEPPHYLSVDARTPSFIEPSSRLALLHKTHEDRDALLPIADPKYVIKEEDVVKHRYYRMCSSPADIYVGDMWYRRAAKDREREERLNKEPPVVQV